MIDTSEFMKNYVDQVTAAKMLNISQSRISQLCTEGRFQGASKIGWSWIIPKVAVENFKPQKRGPKPTALTPEQTKEVISEALGQPKEDKNDHDKQ